MDKEDYYKTIAPRPTVCVSTISEAGTSNLAPYSFATPLKIEPPIIGVVAGGEKDTLLNARETEDFVVVPLTDNWKNEGIRSEIELPRSESEFTEIGLTESETEKVEAPGVKEAPINLECVYHDEKETAGSYILVGKVINITVEEGAIKEGRINLEKLGSVGHIGGEEFCVVDETISIKRD